jgi:uncharacterized protein YdeI (BOF family)
MSTSTKTLAAAAAALVVISALPTESYARERGQNAQRQRHAVPAGQWTRTTERQRTDDGHTRRDTWQGADGRSASRDVVVANDAENKTRTRNGVWTGPKGNQATVDTVTQKTDDGFTRNTVVTKPDGSTANRDLTVVNDKEAGTRSVSIDRTGFEGRTSSYDSVAQKTDDGYTRNVTQVLPNGQTRTRSADVSCDGAGKCTKVVDNNGGASGGE